MVKEDINYANVLLAVKLSDCLGQSKRQLNLFSYLLSKTESAEYFNVSQYDLAVKIFGRNETFDPTTDSIVRVEMHRLRSSLKTFSERSDKYVLEIPRASFQIKVRHKNKNSDKLRISSLFKLPTLIASSILIFTSGYLSNQALSLEKKAPGFAECSSFLPNVFIKNTGTKSELQHYHEQIIRSVISQQTSMNLISTGSKCTSNKAPSFVLEYLLFEESDNFNFNLTLRAEETNEILTFQQFIGKPNEVRFGEDVYFELVRAINEISKPYGIIGKKSLTLNWDNPQSQQSLKCLIAMYDSFSSDNIEEANKAQTCLESAAQQNVVPLDVLGGLAAGYVYMSGQDPTATGSRAYYLQKAKLIIDEVGENWVDSSEMLIAKMSYEKERSNFNADSLRLVISVAKNRYNTNPQVILTASVYAGYALGDWEEARSLSNFIKNMHTDRDNSVFEMDAAYALIFESPDLAIATCKRAYSKSSTLSNLLLNACALEAEDHEWVLKTGKVLDSKNLSTPSQKIAFIRTRNLEPQLAKKMISLFESAPPLTSSFQ